MVLPPETKWGSLRLAKSQEQVVPNFFYSSPANSTNIQERRDFVFVPLCVFKVIPCMLGDAVEVTPLGSPA